MSKLYSFVNSYLSDIQRGIQTAHLVNEFWQKYLDKCLIQHESFIDWAYLQPTIVILNGGNHADLGGLGVLFKSIRNVQYPFASYHEDDDSLNGVLTAVGIILPEKFSDKLDRMDYVNGLIGDSFDYDIACILIGSHAA